MAPFVMAIPLCISSLLAGAEVIKSCRFLGRAEVALSDTLAMLSGVPYGTPLWFPLMRRGGGDNVIGQLQLRFQWEITARGLLTIKLHALERVLAQVGRLGGTWVVDAGWLG